MSVISKKSFLNKADKQQSNWEQTTGQEAGGVLNKQDFIRQAQSAAQQRRQAQEQKAPQSERSGFDRTATPASIAGLGAPAPTSQRQKERYNQEIGQYGVGNIDLYNRPQYRNADGSISTVDSTSFNIQGKEVLLPSVWMKDGKAYRSSDGDEILQHLYDTGELLGVFDTVDAANSYAEKLHDAQDYYYTTQREKALDEAVAHDQLQGMKRTLAILESQKKQEQVQQPGILSMLGKASDSTLPTFRADSAQSETDRRIQELQDEIDRQESESQMQGTKRPETYTAKNVGRYKDRLIALASVPGTWTKRQKQEAEEIIGTQSGFGGLLGYEQNVTAFAPYQEAMRKGDTEAAKQWQQIYDVLYTRLYSRQTAVASGLQEGLGVTSAAAAVGKALGANEDEYHRQMENAQRAQAEHPVLAGGAKIAGSLALMSGIGEAAGAGLAAAGMNTGSLGFKVAAGALSFAGADAVHNAGAAAMGDMSTKDYLKRIAISGAQGMAGNLAGGLVGTGLANALRDTHKMTPFMEFLRQTASGVTNASVNQAVGYLAADEKPTKEEIATNLVTAFAFSVLSSAISSYQTTQQQKAQMNQAYQAIEQGYRAMTAGTENMTPEAKAQRAQFIMQQTQSLRESVNSYYIAGQQKAVDNLNETLDLIDEAMRAYVNGYAAASSAMQTPNVMLPGGGSTGQLPTAADLPTTPTDPQMQKQVEQELQTAIQQGLQQAQAGTQNTQPPQSGQALQNGNAAAAAAQIAVQAAEQNQQAQQPSLPTTAQAAAVQPQRLEQSMQQEAGLPTPQQVQTEQTATPLERLETMGVSGKRAQSMARGIEAFYRGQITDGEVLSKLLSFPEVQNVMRQMTDADIEAGVSGNVQAQNQQLGNTAAQQVPGSQQPGVQNEVTTHEGGMNNGTEQLPAGQQPGTEQQSEQLPDGDGGRILGESTGGQSGILAEGRPQRAFNQGRTAVERENLGRTLRLEKVSSQSLGLPNGTEEREIQVMPESHWDAQMQQTAQRISYETGKPVTYVLGSIRIRQADGSVSAARGVYTENGIIVQADHRYLNIDQIADHEAFHDIAANNPGLVRQIEQAIVEQYSREEFDAVVEKYLKNLRGVYDLPEYASGQEVDEVYGIVKEEICADAYAGINFFGAHAEKYRSEAQAVLQARKITTPGSETAAATQRRTGPPERYSIGEITDKAGNNYGRGVHLDSTLLENLSDSERVQMVKERVKELGGQHFTAYDGDGNEVDIQIAKPGARFVNKSGKSVPVNKDLTTKNRKSKVKQEAVVLADELINTAKHKKDTPARYPHGWLDDNGRNDWAEWKTYIQDKENTVWEATLHIATSADGEKILYDIDPIKKTGQSGNSDTSTVEPIVADEAEPVKREDEEEMPKLMNLQRYSDIAGQQEQTAEMTNAEPTTVGAITSGSQSLGGSAPAISSASEASVAEKRQSVKIPSASDESSENTNKAPAPPRQYQNGTAKAENRPVRVPTDASEASVAEKRLPVKARFSVDEPQAETGGEIEQAPESKPAEPEQKEKKPRKKNETKPVAESLPIIAKRNLRQDMQGIFSIPEGRRAEINQIIDGLADRMLKNGELTQEDRDAFFDRMYAEGVMEVAADEYLQQARSEIAGRRIYVPESVKHEFGDDWGYFRKKAFAAGVMLVNDTSAAGIDMVNAELADTLPGMFHADDLDSREILENIVQTAEEGKNQNMSLAQYTALLAGQEYVSEDEVLDNIERQMDEALRTFTRTAKLEVHLRDRTGVKIAQEREKSAAARQREALSRAKERQQRKEMSQRQREYRELKEQQKKTLKALQWLAKNQYRAPEELQGTWDEVLGDLDIYAVSAANEMRYSKKYDATWKDLAEMYKDAQANDPNFLPSKELEKIVHRLDNKKIADMDLNALQDLYKAAVGLRTEFYNRNNVINDDMNRLFAEVYTDSKKELDFGAQTKAGEAARQGKKLDSLFNQEQLSPMNVMQRMAGWNPNSAWYSMAKQLEKGERDIRDYTVSATKQLREFLTEHEDWAKKADGQGDDGIWYEVKIPQLVGALEVGKPPKFGDTITVWMTPTQKVHMYLESKSTENLRHMEGGRTFADKTLYSQGKRREAFAQGKTVRMAPETVKAIVGSLTPEEQELAQALEQYYNVFAKKEINRVSNILYGYDKAVSKNYTPIYTNSNYTKSELGVYDATAEGVGNLKSRQFSKNPSYNIGAFDAFERHVEQTARFVGMAIPARNWQTLLNWRERENSMADIITHDWGDESLKYIQDLVQTLQGGAASTRDSVSMGAEKVFSNYIGAVFGANPSIVFKQLGSIPLAGAWLDFKNFPSPGQVKRIDRSLIEKYTQELDWRTLGYSTPETKQLKENPNWTQTNKFTNFIFGGGAITAMDGWAASVLWPWAENKVRAEFPELETGSQEQIDSGSSPFYQKVAEVFNEAVARSQSTSDEMHQGTLRKSKNPVTRAFTMFKSDSSQTYNALRQRAGEAEYYKRIGDTENYNKAKRGLGVAFLAAVGGYIWAQGIEFLMNLWKRKGKAYRDEDGNLTAGSVAKEMALGLVGDLAGIVTYGEELADVIGNIITGDKWYGIDTPGLEQLSDVVETIVEQGQNGLDVLKDAADIVKNGGSLGEYLHRHSGDIVGGIKDLAAAAATYLPGISVNNLEAYLLGTVRWASPKLAAAYDDALATANKNQMKGLRGAELERKISDTLHNRRVKTDETTNETLASLYESGFTKAVPSDTPGSISVDGEDRKLSAYQKQVYDKTWSGAVGSRLQELIASDVFQAADDETQEKMLSGLYEYAGEKAKAAVFDDYEVKTSTQKADDVLATGAEMADYLELKLAGAVDKYLDAIDGGLYTQSAKDVALGMAELAPEEGKKTVSDVQKWRAAIDAVDGADAQHDALLAVMKDSTKQKYEIADSYGIEARTWVQLKEILPQFDEDGNGSYKGEEIENAIDALNGHSGIMLPGGDGPQQLTNEMRAVLWQLFTGSKSAKNNPYSERVGSQVIAEREKAKQED